MSTLKNKVVCHVTSVHPWDDIRIFKKEAISVAKHAKKVYLVATNAPDDCINNVHVVSVDFPKNYSRLIRIIFLKKKVIKKALELNADIYHLHDPELLSGVGTFRKKGKEVIYDSHEDVPKTILSKKWIKPGFLRKWIASVYNSYEKRIGRKCSGIISVLPEITNQFDNKNTETIYNYPFSSEPIVKKENDLFSIIYVGGLTRIRGIKEVCAAMNQLSPEYQLTLVGKWESEEFRNECLSLVTNREKIQETGFVSHEKCQELIQESNLGIATLYKEPNYLNSLPIKAFEYATHEVPVLMSNIPYWETEFGSFAAFVDPKNSTDIANQIIAIKNDYHRYLANVKLYRQNELSNKNWDIEEKKLISFYENILNK